MRTRPRCGAGAPRPPCRKPDWLGKPLGSASDRVIGRQNAWTRIQRNPATERGFKPSPADSFRVFRPRRCAARSEAGVLASRRQAERRAAGRPVIFLLAGLQILSLTFPAAPAKEQAPR